MTARLVTLFILLNILDTILTSHILSAGGFEAIPTSRVIIDNFGFVGLGMVKAAIGGALVYALCERACSWFDGRRVAIGLNVALIIVCAWNWYGVVGGP